MGARTGGLVADVDDLEERRLEEERKKEFMTEKAELKEEETKKKIDDLWASKKSFVSLDSKTAMAVRLLTSERVG